MKIIAAERLSRNPDIGGNGIVGTSLTSGLQEHLVQRSSIAWTVAQPTGFHRNRYRR